MLVLTRKLMEKLYIGDDICITVVRLEGGQVRLGIEAPREIAVVRAELVPERATSAPRGVAPNGHRSPRAVHGAHPMTPTPAAGTTNLAPADARLRMPQAAVHGSDSRRREPSQ
jgi:carbon storage regulator